MSSRSAGACTGQEQLPAAGERGDWTGWETAWKGAQGREGLKKYKNTVAVKSILGTGKHRTDVAEGGVSMWEGSWVPSEIVKKRTKKKTGRAKTKDS